MDKLLVEALVAFNYSPNGWDNARSMVGEEIYLPEGVVKGLMDLDPPFVKIVDEDKKPIVFSSDSELAEKELGVDEVEDIEIPMVEEENEEVEDTIEVELEDDDLVEEIESVEFVEAPKTAQTKEELEQMVVDAEKGADEIDLGVYFKAIQKSGSWYNVVKKGHEEDILNEKGIARKELAEFVYNLYIEEA